MRDSFIFYKSWWDAVGLLPGEVRGEVLTAIIEYGLTGETNSHQSNTTKAILELIKPQIDANNKRYENGKSGGRPKSIKAAGETETEPDHNREETKEKPKGNQTITIGKPKANREETKAEPNVYVNDNVNVYENDNVFSSRTREAVAEVSEEEKRNFFEIFFFRNFQDPSREVKRFIAWNGKQGKHPTKYDAELWNPEVREKRFSEGFIKAWKALYTAAKFSGPDGEEAAFLMLDSRLSMKAINGKWQLQCPEKVAAWLNENQETAEMLKPALRGYPLGIKTYRT